MEIRALTPADADTFQALMLFALRELPAGFAVTYGEVEAETMGSVRERLRHADDPMSRVFGAFADDGTLVGIVGIRQYGLLRMRHKATVGRMYVAPSHRRGGLARRLIDEVLAFARGVGIEQVNLIVDDHNTAARRLYESIGFVPFGLEPRELKIGDEYTDSMHMWLRLGE